MLVLLLEVLDVLLLLENLMQAPCFFDCHLLDTNSSITHHHSVPFILFLNNPAVKQTLSALSKASPSFRRLCSPCRQTRPCARVWPSGARVRAVGRSSWGLQRPANCKMVRLLCCNRQPAATSRSCSRERAMTAWHDDGVLAGGPHRR